MGKHEGSVLFELWRKNPRPEFKPEPWSDDNHRLADVYALARQARNVVVSLRPSGEDKPEFKEAVELLRDISKKCRADFMAWHPTEHQRKRPQ